MRVDRRNLLAGLLSTAALRSNAQGFAGLGADARGFAVPRPGSILDFPTDHGPHPKYRIEWWYLTANLKGPDNADYGTQWTLFRSALQPGEAPGWQSPQIWMGHAALTSRDQHFVAEKFARGGTGQAGVKPAPFDAWIDTWRLFGPSFDALRVLADGPGFAYDLTLTATGPLVAHGEAGYSVKSADGQSSYYYSQPRFDMSGGLILDGTIIPVAGKGWLDREWSSQPLAEDQTGWDWFSLTFDDGTQMMAFRLRGARGEYTSATWIDAAGTARAIANGELQVEPLGTSRIAGRDIPTSWRVLLESVGLAAVVEALNPKSWMELSVAYWEGPVRVSGNRSGVGYLEMTGY